MKLFFSYKQITYQQDIAKNSLVLFDFQLSDLQDNKNNYTGERNPTGYKVQVIDMLNNGKIRSTYKDNIFR